MRSVQFISHSFVCFVIHYVCLYVSGIIAKVISQVSLKLGVTIWPTNRKNWLTFGSDPGMDFGLHFHFPLHCGIGF